MIASPSTQEDLTLNITLESHVRAPLEATFAALLEQVGPGFETPEGKSLSMKIEPRPGGRWYRDLGDDNGHFWGVVQAIKRPTLLEMSGPLAMSTAVLSNVQYRLAAVEGGTLISFRHTAFGFMPAGFRDGVHRGWSSLLDGVRRRAEAAHPSA
jgi:uncharacterized protein YndB with AHSA1/START domain